MERLHEDYCSACVECKAAQDLAALGQQDHMTKRDFQRVEENAAKAMKRQDDTAAAYKTALTTYNETQYEWINEMLLACKEFEDAEIARIEFLKQTMQVPERVPEHPGLVIRSFLLTWAAGARRRRRANG